MEPASCRRAADMELALCKKDGELAAAPFNASRFPAVPEPPRPELT